VPPTPSAASSVPPTPSATSPAPPAPPAAPPTPLAPSDAPPVVPLATPPAHSAPSGQAPPVPSAAPSFDKPPVIHVYSRCTSASGSPPEPATGTSLRRSNIVPSPPRYVKNNSSLPPGALSIPPVDNTHGMTTRGKAGYQQPRLALHTEVLSPAPRSRRDALACPHWRRAMEEEHAALLDNHTWDLVP
jgi:hypothetical protein